MKISPYKRIGCGELDVLLSRLVCSALIYGSLSIYLYLPYLKSFSYLEFLFLSNSAIGAMGCFVLSRRWISSFTGSLFAGVIYGYSPFSLGFAAFHPLAGVTLAMLGWLFIPAAFWRKFLKDYTNAKLPADGSAVSTAVSAALCAVPFVFVMFLFWVCSTELMGPFFPLPNEKMQVANLTGFLTPFAGKPCDFIFSIYHLPVCSMLMGLFLYFASGRVGVGVLAGAGLYLSFSEPIFETSPVVWGLVPLLFMAVLVGFGMQGLVWAGSSDRKWVLGCFVITAVISAIAFITANTYSGIMFALGAILLASLFFVSRAGIRWHLLRWVLFCTGFTVDILSGAKYTLDQIFGVLF